MSEPSAISYEDLPYEESVYFHTHPDRMATLATLLGMPAAPAKSSRILELGSGMGTNLVAIAQTFPESQCLGIDLSPRQTAAAQELVRTLGLRNVEFRAADLMDLDDGLGKFDYILCHGVYSWVPRAVRDRLLALCVGLLAPYGLAYVSYNVYPGWHQRSVIREMMLYHSSHFQDSAQRVRQARALALFLHEVAGGADNAYGQLWREQIDRLKERSDAGLAHDFLEANNEPVYFYQFMDHAAAHRLQFLGEAQLYAWPAGLSSQARETLKQLPDRIHLEQYLDFIRNGTFRRTLLCHADVKLQGRSGPERLVGLRVSAELQPVAAEPEVASDAIEHFKSEDGISLSSASPLQKAVLASLARAVPRALSLEELWDEVKEQLSSRIEVLQSGPLGMAECVVQCYFAGVANLHRHVPPVADEVSERPLASPLARLQAAKRQPIPNVWHRRVKLSPLHCQVLRFLDGTRTAKDLADIMVGLVMKDELTLEQDGQPLRDPEQVRQACGACLGPVLGDLAKSALLLTAAQPVHPISSSTEGVSL